MSPMFRPPSPPRSFRFLFPNSPYRIEPATCKRRHLSTSNMIVVSLGNPGKEYQDTLHSAGHMALQCFQKQFAREQPSFQHERAGGQAVSRSVGRYTMLQSPVYMNLSGPWVAKVWREEVAMRGLDAKDAGLVIVHDDLELDLGRVKIRDWGSSHRGHNGIKSINGVIRQHQLVNAARISVGIGRPDARDRSTVSDYVLGRIPSRAKAIFEKSAGYEICQALTDLERRWSA